MASKEKHFGNFFGHSHTVSEYPCLFVFSSDRLPNTSNDLRICITWYVVVPEAFRSLMPDLAWDSCTIQRDHWGL